MRLRSLLLILLLLGLLTFRRYGYTWDEPLYYGYAEALPYAYQPWNWLRPDFDLEKAYGPSPADHKTRGPAYLLLSYPFAALLQSLGLPRDEAWHLVNFLAFLLGLVLFHRLARRWFSPFVSLSITALFATQPLLWGHAFINPKDIPFLFAFLGAILFGLEMVDSWAQGVPSWRRTLLASFFLGYAIVLRVIAPLAAVLILACAWLRRARPPLRHLFTYLLGAALLTLALWPYLWTDPIGHFLEVFFLMTNNIASMKVLFNGNLYPATALPGRYLPFLILITITETTWLLAILGLILNLGPILHRSRQQLRLTSDLWRARPTPGRDLCEAGIVAAWFLIPLIYVIFWRPPMYDNHRHFFFILPPLFYLAGLGLESLLQRLNFPAAWRGLLLMLIFLPGLLNIAVLYPYEYTYYNSLIGGPAGAFGRFETDYWLTCYKESLQTLNAQLTGPIRLFVWREPLIAMAYAGPNVQVHSLREEPQAIHRGDYLLVNTRAFEDRGIYPLAPEVLRVQRAGATYCIVRRLGK
jgi:hypothetical protein